jgi:hypothetical protein
MAEVFGAQCRIMARDTSRPEVLSKRPEFDSLQRALHTCDVMILVLKLLLIMCSRSLRKGL